jgi:hypothetical protein
MAAHNPYVPPTSATPVVNQPNRLWWAYFVLRALYACAGLAVFSLSMESLLLASHALDAICVVGLFFYIRNKPFIGLRFWQVVLGLYLVKVIANQTLNINKAIALQRADWLAVSLEVVTTVPLAFALWLYVFKSPHLWRSSSAG